MKPDHDTETTETDDTAQPYQLTRRDLIRGAAATGTIAATGAVGQRYPAINPVGRAQAVVPLVPIAAGLAVGFLGYALYDTLTEGDVDTTDVTDAITARDAYNAFEAVMIAQESAISQHEDYLGVDNSTEPSSLGANLVEPTDNALAHGLVETALAKAAQEWQAGSALGTAQVEALKAMRVQSVSSEYNVVSTWNDAMLSILPTLIQHENAGLNVIKADPLEYTSFNGTYDLVPAISTNHDPVGADQLDAGEGEAMIGRRDISNTFPVSIDDIPEEERPQHGFSIFEPFTNLSQGVNLFTPYHGVASISGEWTNSSRSDKEPDTRSFGIQIRHTTTDRTLKFPTWKFQELLYAVREIRRQIEADLDQAVEKVYNGLSTGTIDVADVTSGRQMYQLYEPTSNDSRLAIELQSLGNLDDPGGTQVRIAVDGVEHAGYLYVDVAAEIVATDDLESENDVYTIAAADYTSAQLLKPGTARPIYFDGSSDIDILEIYGADSLTYAPRTRLGPQGVDSAEVEQYLADNQERYQDLVETVEELEAQNSPFGLGTGGDLQNYGIVAGIAAIAALLFGR